MAASGNGSVGPLDERRRYRRLRCKTEIRFRDLYKPQQKYASSLSKDVSVGGLRLDTIRFLPKDVRLVLLLSLPGVTAEPRRAIGRVVWVRRGSFSDSYECGLQFVEVTPADHELLADCVERGLVFS